jgi:hypothetical protein
LQKIHSFAWRSFDITGYIVGGSITPNIGHIDFRPLESENVSSSKGEEGYEMRVKGQYMGREEEMKLEFVDKEPNKKLVTKQTEAPYD